VVVALIAVARGAAIDATAFTALFLHRLSSRDERGPSRRDVADREVVPADKAGDTKLLLALFAEDDADRGLVVFLAVHCLLELRGIDVGVDIAAVSVCDAVVCLGQCYHLQSWLWVKGTQ